VLPYSFASARDDTASTTEEELYQQCKRTYTEGKFDDAGQHVKQFLSLYPESDHAGEILSIQAFLQSNIDAAMKMHRLIIEKFPNSKWAAKAHFQLGQCCYLQGRYDEALEHYGTIIVYYSEDEVYWPALYWKCKSLIAKGDCGKAVAVLHFLKDSSSADIGKDMILMSLGNCYLCMRDYQRAADSYRSLIEAMPDSRRIPSAYLLLARSLQNLGESEEAKKFYQKVIEDYSQSIESQQAQEYLGHKEGTRRKTQDARQGEKASGLESKVLSPGSDKESRVLGLKAFSIQIGAFSRRRNAENLANRLRKKGYSVSILSPSPGRSSLYKVRVGRFKTRSAALKAAKRLGKNERLDTEVVH
jgi:TolA-binding protein